MSSLFRHLRHGCVLSSLACLYLVPEPLRAQDSSRVHHAPWLTTFSVGVPGYRQEAIAPLFTVGANFTEHKPFQPALDFSVGTMPILFLKKAAALGVRAGGALPLALSPHFLVLPSGGISLVGAIGEGGSDGIAGLNGGVAVMLLGNDLAGARVGVTWHKFDSSNNALWLLEVGVVRPLR